MWRQLKELGGVERLMALAVACLTLVPTSCAVERQIKENSLIHTPERNCLGIESLSAQLLVRFATTRGLFQPWRRAAPPTRKRNRLTAEDRNAKVPRPTGAAESVDDADASRDADAGRDAEAGHDAAEDAATEDKEPEEAEVPALSALTLAPEDEEEAAENVADWNEQEGREVLLQLIAGVPGAPPEPVLTPPPRELPAVRRTGRSTAGKDSRQRFE